MNTERDSSLAPRQHEVMRELEAHESALARLELAGSVRMRLSEIECAAAEAAERRL